MGKAKKKFIDRKNAVTFHLVHRSQHDPLITDETAPQRVLLEAAVPEDQDKRREQQKKFGVFYDDDYNYLQHLKKPGKDVVWEYVAVPNQKKDKQKPEIQLPSSLFATEFEEDEGLLNKAAPRPGPRPDWHPEIVAALDNDFDFENPDNQLDDDFFEQAMAEGSDNEFDEVDEEDEDDADDEVSSGQMSSDGEEDDDELRDNLAPLMRNRRFSDEETNSRFTEYSMSSSVIRRNEQLTLLDDRFEKFFETYDDPEMGPLDMEEIEGHIKQTDNVMKRCYNELNKNKKILKYKKSWDTDRIKKYLEEHPSSSEDEMVDMEVEDGKEKKWDCESILSTYSNIYNHPKLIDEPRRANKIEIDPKTGIPKNILRGFESDKLTTKTLAKFDSEHAPAQSSAGPKSLCDKSVLSVLSVLSIRPKDETHEEKRERKKLLKEYRNERRMERKANAEAFKEEKKRQTKIKINNQNNIQGNRIC